ncbi:unnamed protein product [Amoebophrya sp. A120]|nr:unnamed protein product [Amoebophrya sp. A120]|eukprot:GSA120T00008331001.1
MELLRAQLAVKDNIIRELADELALYKENAAGRSPGEQALASSSLPLHQNYTASKDSGLGSSTTTVPPTQHGGTINEDHGSSKTANATTSEEENQHQVGQGNNQQAQLTADFNKVNLELKKENFGPDIFAMHSRTAGANSAVGRHVDEELQLEIAGNPGTRCEQLSRYRREEKKEIVEQYEQLHKEQVLQHERQAEEMKLQFEQQMEQIKQDLEQQLSLQFSHEKQKHQLQVTKEKEKAKLLEERQKVLLEEVAKRDQIASEWQQDGLKLEQDFRLKEQEWKEGFEKEREMLAQAEEKLTKFSEQFEQERAEFDNQVRILETEKTQLSEKLAETTEKANQWQIEYESERLCREKLQDQFRDLETDLSHRQEHAERALKAEDALRERDRELAQTLSDVRMANAKLDAQGDHIAKLEEQLETTLERREREYKENLARSEQLQLELMEQSELVKKQSIELDSANRYLEQLKKEEEKHYKQVKDLDQKLRQTKKDRDENFGQLEDYEVELRRLVREVDSLREQNSQLRSSTTPVAALSTSAASSREQVQGQVEALVAARQPAHQSSTTPKRSPSVQKSSPSQPSPAEQPLALDQVKMRATSSPRSTLPVESRAPSRPRGVSSVTSSASKRSPAGVRMSSPLYPAGGTTKLKTPQETPNREKSAHPLSASGSRGGHLQGGSSSSSSSSSKRSASQPATTNYRIVPVYGQTFYQPAKGDAVDEQLGNFLNTREHSKILFSRVSKGRYLYGRLEVELSVARKSSASELVKRGESSSGTNYTKLLKVNVLVMPDELKQEVGGEEVAKEIMEKPFTINEFVHFFEDLEFDACERQQGGVLVAQDELPEEDGAAGGGAAAREAAHAGGELQKARRTRAERVGTRRGDHAGSGPAGTGTSIAVGHQSGANHLASIPHHQGLEPQQRLPPGPAKVFSFSSKDGLHGAPGRGPPANFLRNNPFPPPASSFSATTGESNRNISSLRGTTTMVPSSGPPPAQAGNVLRAGSVPPLVAATAGPTTSQRHFDQQKMPLCSQQLSTSQSQSRRLPRNHLLYSLQTPSPSVEVGAAQEPPQNGVLNVARINSHNYSSSSVSVGAPPPRLPTRMSSAGSTFNNKNSSASIPIPPFTTHVNTDGSKLTTNSNRTNSRERSHTFGTVAGEHEPPVNLSRGAGGSGATSSGNNSGKLLAASLSTRQLQRPSSAGGNVQPQGASVGAANSPFGPIPTTGVIPAAHLRPPPALNVAAAFANKMAGSYSVPQSVRFAQ